MAMEMVLLLRLHSQLKVFGDRGEHGIRVLDGRPDSRGYRD